MPLARRRGALLPRLARPTTADLAVPGGAIRVPVIRRALRGARGSHPADQGAFPPRRFPVLRVGGCLRGGGAAARGGICGRVVAAPPAYPGGAWCIRSDASDRSHRVRDAGPPA